MLKFILAFSYVTTVAFGMDCSWGKSENVLEKIAYSCPRMLLDSSDEKYCCPNNDGGFKCCDLQNFIFHWLLMVWPIILLVLLVLAVLSCVCCCLRHLKIC